MAAWDNVQLPQGPAPASYAGRLIDTSGLGNLYGDYAKQQLLQNQMAMQQPLKARDSQGILNEILSRPGGAQLAPQLLQLMQRQQFMNTYDNGTGEPTQGRSSTTGQTAESGAETAPAARSEPTKVTPSGFPVRQALEGADSIVYDSGPNAGKNIAPEVNAAGEAAGTVGGGPSPPSPVALPPGVSEDAVKNLDKAAATLTNRANKAEVLIGRGAGAGDLAQAKILADRAAKMREQLAAYSPAAVALKGREKLQGLEMDRGVKLNTAIQGGATTYMQSQKPYNDAARTLLADPQMQTGLGGDWQLAVNRARALFGDSKAAALQEALQKVTASSVLAQINNQKIELDEAGEKGGRIFQAQVEQVTRASPSLGTTLGGNRYLINVSDRMGEFKTALAHEANKYKAEHGYLDAGWDGYVEKWLNRHPVFSKEERSNPKLLMSPTVPPQYLDERGNPRNPAELKKWGADLGLKTGDSVILPNNAPMSYVYKHWKQ